MSGCFGHFGAVPKLFLPLPALLRAHRHNRFYAKTFPKRNDFRHRLLALLTFALVGVSCGSNLSTTTITPRSEPTYSVPAEIPLTASADRDANNGTVINGTVINGPTNLPDGTKLGIELMNGGRATAQDFDVFVASGKFRSAGFRKNTSPLPPGKQQVHIFTR